MGIKQIILKGKYNKPLFTPPNLSSFSLLWSMKYDHLRNFCFIVHTMKVKCTQMVTKSVDHHSAKYLLLFVLQKMTCPFKRPFTKLTVANFAERSQKCIAQ